MSREDKKCLIVTNKVSVISPTDFAENKSTLHLSSRYASWGILLAVALERFAFYGLTSNLTNFLMNDPLMWTPFNAMTAIYIFYGVFYMFSVIGGCLADSYVGRYTCVWVFLFVYIIGFGFLTYLAYIASNKTVFRTSKLCNVSDDHTCNVSLYSSLTIMGIAGGIFRATISPFGGDQVKSYGATATRNFFFRYYWFLNVGGIVAILLLGYLQIELGSGFFYSYLSCSLALVLALTFFLAFKKFYIINKPIQKSFANAISILCFSCRSLKKFVVFRYKDEVLECDTPPSSCFDMAKVQYGGKFDDDAVEDVKCLPKVFLIFVLLLPFWLVYYQMQTTFLIQGLYMRRPQDEDFIMPPSYMSVVDALGVLVFIPFLNHFIFPYLETKEIKVTIIKRFVFGQIIVLVAAVVAGGIENMRLNTNKYAQQTFHNVTYNITDISIFYQFPQYLLIGVSECFVYVAGLEFAYSQSPTSMASIVIGIYNFFAGIGSFLGILVMTVVTKLVNWIYDGNGGHKDYYYFLLGGIQLFTIFIIVFLIYCCNLNKSKEKQTFSDRLTSLPRGSNNLFENENNCN